MTVAIALSLVSLVLLIYFIHHVSASIQAAHVIRVIAENLEAAVPNLYPSETGKPMQASTALSAVHGQGTVILALEKSGYLQTVDLDTLLATAEKHDRPYVAGETRRSPSGRLAHLRGSRHGRTAACKHSRDPGSVLRGPRTHTGAGHPVHVSQLTDVIVRALSPGINDPFTAINGIDELAAGLLLFTRRAHIEPYRQGGNGALRLILTATNTAELLQKTVGHIGIYGAGDHFVMDALRRVLDAVESQLATQEEAHMVERLRAELDQRQAAASASGTTGL